MILIAPVRRLGESQMLLITKIAVMPIMRQDALEVRRNKISFFQLFVFIFFFLPKTVGR